MPTNIHFLFEVFYPQSLFEVINYNLLSEQVPEAIWRTLPGNLKKKVQIDTSAKTLRISRPAKSNMLF